MSVLLTSVKLILVAFLFPLEGVPILFSFKAAISSLRFEFEGLPKQYQICSLCLELRPVHPRGNRVAMVTSAHLVWFPPRDFKN